MKRILISLIAMCTFEARAQNVNVINPTTRPVPVSVVSGGGGGGAVTVADGADVTEGTSSDTVGSAGGTGTVSSKLRRLTTDLAALLAKIPANGQTTMAGSQPVTIASDQTAVPVSGTVTVPALASYATAVTTLQNAATGTGNGTALDTTGLTSVALQVTGTYNATATMEATVDGTNWVAVAGYVAGQGASYNFTAVYTIDGNYSGAPGAVFKIPVSGFKQFRARISTYASGSITIVAVGVADGASYLNPTVMGRSGTMADGVDLVSWLNPNVGAATAKGIPSLGYAMTATNNADIVRVAKKIVPFTISASSSETTIWTPTSGKKFRVMGYAVYSDIATTLTFRDNTSGTVILRDGVGATAHIGSGSLGNGVQSTTNNNVLTLQCGTAATLSGTVWGTEE